MANKVLFNLEAEDAKAVQAFLRVVDAQGKAANKTREMNREGKQLKQTFGKLGGAAADIAKIGAGFVSAAGAIQLVRSAVRLFTMELEDLRRKETEAARANMDYAKSFSNIVSTWLGTDWVDRAHQQIRKAVADIPELSYTQGRTLLGAYGAARPTAPLARGMEAVRMAAPLTWENREGVVKLVGELEQLYPGRPMERLFDIASAMRRRAGKRIEEIEPGMKAVHRLLAMGIDPDQALGGLMAAFEAEQAGRSVGTITSLLAYPIKAPKRRPGVRLTEEDQLRQEVAGMSPMELFTWMQENPAKGAKLYKTTWATVAPIMKPGAIEAGVQLIRRAQTERDYQTQLQQAEQSQMIKLGRVGERRAAAVERQQMEWGGGAAIGLTRDYVTQMLRSMPGIGVTRRRLIETAIEVEGRLGEDYIQAALRNLGGLQRGWGQERIPGGYAYYGAGMPRDIPSTVNPMYDPRAADAIAQLIKDIRDQADALKALGAEGSAQGASNKLDRQIELLTDIKDALQGGALSPARTAELD